MHGQRLGITTDRQENVLREALAVEQKPMALERVGDVHIRLNQVPPAWGECRRFVSTDTFERRLTFERTATGSVDPGGVLHLDHAVMRRAIATLRGQMWRSVGTESGTDTLFRISASTSTRVSRPTILAWARLVLVGPERNSLHEGLFVVAAEPNEWNAQRCGLDPNLSAREQRSSDAIRRDTRRC